jgi:glycosyltransferase involved in cell wall biosynthesis
MNKISIITNIPTPYRRKQWEYFSKQDNLDLTIYYGAKIENDRFWTFKKASNISEKFMNGVSLSKFHFNPGILKIIWEDYDLFVMGSYGYPTVMIAILLLRLFNKPLVLIHDGVSPLKLNNEKWHVKLTKGLFMKGADAYFANGTVGKCDLQNYGVSTEKIFNQYLTVDVQDFIKKGNKKEEFRENIRLKHGIDNSSVVVMYSGRLIKSKGVQDLLSAFEKLIKKGYDIKALIVGEGRYKKNLKHYCKEIKSSVIFTGHVEPEEIHKYYYASDIFVLPTYDDPWGLVVNEAMACGLPVIVSKAAGCSMDLVKNNGYVISENDVDGLCDVIIILMDSKVRDSYSKRSEELIKNWSYGNSLKSFNDLIKFIGFD